MKKSPDDQEKTRYVYGLRPVLEALRARIDSVEQLFVVDGMLPSGPAGEILSRAGKANLRVQRVPRERLAALSEQGRHQGVVAELRGYSYADLGDLITADKGSPLFLIALDGIQDPQNLGSIVRSALALGAHGVIIPKDRAASVTGAVAKASAGAVEHLPVVRVVNLSRAIEECKEAGLWVAAADPNGEQVAWAASLTGPLVVVVGAEGRGVRDGVLKHCDLRIRIPIRDQAGSLNAAVAAGVLLYEVARQRRQASDSRPVGRQPKNEA